MLKTADLIRNFLLPTVDLTKNTYRYHKIDLEFCDIYIRSPRLFILLNTKSICLIYHSVRTAQ